MSVLRRVLFSTVVVILLIKMARAGLHGHSGIVLHVDKYGHLSGHSTHYDYRFYPEKSLLAPYPPIDHHNVIGHHHHHLDDEDMHEAFQLIDDEYHHGSEPYFYYVQHKDHHYDHHSYHHQH